MSSSNAGELNKKFYDRLTQGTNDNIAEEVLDYVIFPILEKSIESINIPADQIEVLDIGSGDTGVPTNYLLKLGLKVTETDISEASLLKLLNKFSHYGDRLQIQPGNIFEVLNKYKSDNKQFDIVIARSFLHHIPDTETLLASIEPIISKNGCFISFADPLRYDTIPIFTLAYTKLGYFIWRVRQRNLLRGCKSLMRRFLKKYDINKEEDMVEYHVVRNGVDQELIRNFWSKHSYNYKLIPYFWSPSPIFTLIGKFAKLKNGFAFYAYKIGSSRKSVRKLP